MATVGPLNLVIRRFVALLLALAVRLLRATWRVRFVNPPSDATGGRLLAFWHGDQLQLTTLPRPLSALVSLSEDGELASRVLRALGFGVVRGSSSRGAVAGALGLARRMHEGQTVAVAVDGPRGPRQRTDDRLLRLADRVGAPVLPVAAAAGRAWQLRSWDRFVVPGPFARVVVVWGSAVTGGLQRALDSVRSEAERRISAGR